MSNKIDVNKINLQIDNIEFWGPHKGNKGGIRVYWSSSIGFGSLDIVKRKGPEEDDPSSRCENLEMTVHTECMDRGTDKTFTKKILTLLSDKLLVVD